MEYKNEKACFIINKKIVIVFSLLILFFYKRNINIMFFFSKNFGDNLNYFLLKDMINGNVNFYDSDLSNANSISCDSYYSTKLNEISKIDFFFIGSILERICSWSYVFHNQNNIYKTIISKLYFKIFDYFYPLIIFGTGFISYPKFKHETYIRNIKIIATRGNISLQRFKNNGIKPSGKVILADPGILAPLLVNITNINEIKIKKKFKLCVIPHYIDMNIKLIKKRIHIKNFVILNINNNPLLFIKSISKCNNVLSSSLHGLIIADSLGIPNMRIVISNNVKGGDYKYIDYYSGYNLKLPHKIDLRKTIFSYKDLKNLRENHFIQEDIIKNKQCDLLPSKKITSTLFCWRRFV